MSDDINTKYTVETKVRRIKADDYLGPNLERQANTWGEQGFVLRSSFVLNEYVICVYQRSS